MDLDLHVGGWLSPIEGSMLSYLSQKCRRGGSIVNIGCAHGRSIHYIFENVNVPVYAIDICMSKRMKGFKLLHRKNLILLEGDSKDKKIIDSVKEPIELLFIDGDHSYDGIFGDITNWVPKVMSGGYIVIHDVFSEQVNDEHKCPDIIKAIHDTLGDFTDFRMCNKFGFMKEKWSRVDTCMILQKE